MTHMDTDGDPCPRCGTWRLHPTRTRNSLSRQDNETYVCSSCGTDEAMRNFAGLDAWPNYPYVIQAEAKTGGKP